MHDFPSEVASLSAGQSSQVPSDNSFCLSVHLSEEHSKLLFIAFS